MAKEMNALEYHIPPSDWPMLNHWIQQGYHPVHYHCAVCEREFYLRLDAEAFLAAQTVDGFEVGCLGHEGLVNIHVSSTAKEIVKEMLQ